MATARCAQKDGDEPDSGALDVHREIQDERQEFQMNSSKRNSKRGAKLKAKMVLN